MPSYPDGLYQPSLADIAKAISLPQRYFFNTANTAAATAVSTQTNPVPTDRVLILQHAMIVFQPGAAQTCTRAEISVIDTPLGITQFEIGIQAPPALVATQDGLIFSPHDIVLMPGERINWTARFDAAVNPNLVGGSVVGVLIPRGNWQPAPS